MITLIKHKEAARALRNAVIGIDGIAQNPPGTVIEYHIGDWSDNIGATKVGKMAKELSDQGRVILYQKIVQYEPMRKFSYRVMVK